MSTAGISGLPSRPLTEGDVQTLNRHPGIGFCNPVYQLEDEDDAFVSVVLGIDDRVYVLIYNPDEEEWEQGEAVDAPESLTEPIEFDSEETQGRFEAYYDEGEVVPVDYSQDPMETFAGSLPQEPLSDDQLAAIRERPFVIEAAPFARRERDDCLLTLLLAFKDSIRGQGIIGGYGYDPTEGEWRLLNTVEGSDSDREAAVEALADEIGEWLVDRYSRDEFRIVEDLGPAFNP